jgi:hypothetical protein
MTMAPSDRDGTITVEYSRHDYSSKQRHSNGRCVRPVQLWYKHPLEDLRGARARKVELEEEAGRNHEDEDGDEDLQLSDLQH